MPRNSREITLQNFRQVLQSLKEDNVNSIDNQKTYIALLLFLIRQNQDSSQFNNALQETIQLSKNFRKQPLALDVIFFIYGYAALRAYNPFFRYGHEYCVGILLEELAYYAIREKPLPELLKSSVDLIFKNKDFGFSQTYQVNGKNYSLFGFLLLHEFRDCLTDLIKIPAFRNAIEKVFNDDLLHQIVGKNDPEYFVFLQRELLGKDFDGIFKGLYKKTLIFSIEMNVLEIFAWLIDQQDKLSLDEKEAEELKNYIISHYRNDPNCGCALLASLGFFYDVEDFYEESLLLITSASEISHSRNIPASTDKKSSNTVNENGTSGAVSSTSISGTSGAWHSRTENATKRSYHGGGAFRFMHGSSDSKDVDTHDDGVAQKKVCRLDLTSRDGIEMAAKADATVRSVDARSPALDSDSGSEDSDWNESESESTPIEWRWKHLEELIKPGQKYLMHCRGVHCFRQNSHDNPAYFSFSSKEARKLFLSETKKNPMLLSPVLYSEYKKGKASSVSEPERFLEQKQKAQEVTQAYQSLAEDGEIEIEDYNHSGEKRRFKNRQAFFNQLFTNSYDRHATTLKAESDPTNPFHPTYPFTQHPFVCMTDTPKHALRYAYGQKVSGDRWEDRLRPCYDNNGLAKHCHAGVLYVTLHEASKYRDALKRHVLAAYANNEVDIHVRIVNERETSFVANIDADNIVLILPIKYPSFLEYNKRYHDRFGIDQSKFDEFKQRIKNTKPGTDEHRKVKDDIIAHVSRNLIDKLGTHLKENIEDHGGQLVYASLWGGIQETLPSLQAAKALRHYVRLQNVLINWLNEPDRWQNATVAKYEGLAQLCSLFLGDGVREELKQAPTERYSCLHKFIKACEENRESCAAIAHYYQQQQLEEDKHLISKNSDLLFTLFKYQVEDMPCFLQELQQELHQCFDALERLQSAKLEGNLALLVRHYIEVKDYLAEFQRAWDIPYSRISGNVQAAHLRVDAGSGISTQKVSSVSANVSREYPIKLKSPFERLLEAIKQNNLKDVERFAHYQIAEKAPGSYETEKDANGDTALHHGIRLNNEEIVSKLLAPIYIKTERHYASRVVENKQGDKPLHLAAMSGNVKIMEKLLLHNMGVDYRSLKLAVENGHRNAVAFLIKERVDFRPLIKDLPKAPEDSELLTFLKDFLFLYQKICNHIQLVCTSIRDESLSRKCHSLIEAGLTGKESIAVVQVMRDKTKTMHETHHNSAIALRKSIAIFLEKHLNFPYCYEIVRNLCEVSDEKEKSLINCLSRDGEDEFITYLSSLGVTFNRLPGRYENSAQMSPIILAVMRARNLVVSAILNKNPHECNREYRSKQVGTLAAEKKKEYEDLKSKLIHQKVQTVLGENCAVILKGMDEKIEAYEKIVEACARVAVVESDLRKGQKRKAESVLTDYGQHGFFETIPKEIFPKGLPLNTLEFVSRP